MQVEFKVINPQKYGVMRTNYLECIPNHEVLKEMSESGYKFTLNGKRITVNEIEKLRGA